MKTLKFPTLFILLFSCFMSFGQQSQELKMDFNTLLQSQELLVEQYDAAFIGISAYTMQEGFTSTIYYRVKGEKGWKEWQAFTLFTEGNTPGRTTFEGPAIEESITKIQFKTDQHTEKEITVRLYFAAATKKKTSALNQIQGGGANCSCIQPAICYRNCWCPGNNCPKDATPSYTQADHIIVHHSAGTNSSNDWPAVVSYIWDLHVNTNGWDDIGYNWLIDPEGIIYEGRGDSVQGAHFSCMNGNTTGICLIGNFTSIKPTDSAIVSLIEMVAWEGCDKNIAPAATTYHSSSQLMLPNVAGHRHGNASTAPNSCAVGTACPGDSLFPMLALVRDSAASFGCLGDVSSKEYGLLNNELILYPNPTKQSINITISPNAGNSKVQIMMYNSNGAVILNERTSFSNQGEIELDVDNLPAGVYRVEMISSEEKRVGQFVKY